MSTEKEARRTLGEELFAALAAATPLIWCNPSEGSAVDNLPVDAADMAATRARWERLRVPLAALFPDECPDGRVQSPLVPLKMKTGRSYLFPLLNMIATSTQLWVVF
jgi:D-serine dehydratase